MFIQFLERAVFASLRSTVRKYTTGLWLQNHNDNFTTSPRSPNYARDRESEEGLGSGIRNEAMAGARPIIKLAAGEAGNLVPTVVPISVLDVCARRLC